MSTLGGKETECSGSWTRRLSRVNITSGSLFTKTTVKFSFACDLTEFSGERVKGRSGGSTADDSGCLGTSARSQVRFIDADETIEGCRAETKTATATGVWVVDDLGESEWREHLISA